MKKSELVSKISKQFHYLTNQDIDESVKATLNLISESLQNGNRVEIRGFGSFSSRKRSSRMARNPNTGKAISVVSKFHPYFRASKSLKADLNK
tara:strand:+ start:223 stop:501 length:279 start_codon:yes stop_codon:yes gene_type:complete